MAKLDDNASTQKSTVLFIGNNGSGKTGALASLALAGYKLRIIDCDNGTEILKQILTPQTGRKLYSNYSDNQLNSARDNIDVETCQDIYGGSAGNPAPKLPLQGFSKTCKVIDNWPGLGKPSEWGLDTVLVLDSLTLLGKYIMNHVLSLNMHLGKPPQIQHWGAAMDLQETLMNMITGPALKCHVVVTAHVTFINEEGELAKQGFPSALGSKLPPKIGSYFNSTLHVDKDSKGEKLIRTQAKGMINCKTSAPGKVPPTLPLETGLADYFKALHGNLEVKPKPVNTQTK